MSHVLVADDDEDIRRLVVMKLRSAGHEVTDVGDGDAAVAAATADPPDLAVLDLMMPGLTGVQVCAAFRADPELSHVPVVLLTARAQERDQAEGLAAGVDAYLSKPFRAKVLLEELSPYLDDRTSTA